MIITALDPGLTTGVATVSTKAFPMVGVLEVVGGLGVWNYLSNIAPNVIVYESFNKRNKFPRYESIEIIGVIKLWQDLHPGVRTYTQSSSEGKNFWDNEKLKDVGVYTVGMQHGRDATRHLLTFISKDVSQYYMEKLSQREVP